MKDLKSIVTLVVVLAIAALAVWALVSNNGSFGPYQKTGIGEVNLDNELSNVDNTNLDSNFDSQMNQLASESSTF